MRKNREVSESTLETLSSPVHRCVLSLDIITIIPGSKRRRGCLPSVGMASSNHRRHQLSLPRGHHFLRALLSWRAPRLSPAFLRAEERRASPLKSHCMLSAVIPNDEETLEHTSQTFELAHSVQCILFWCFSDHLLLPTIPWH